jgi:hypothetical protein
MQKIILWATDENGDGRVMKIGEYETIEDIEIIVNMFNKDVVLTFEYETEEN